jgi:hypothetical protein
MCTDYGDSFAWEPLINNDVDPDKEVRKVWYKDTVQDCPVVWSQAHSILHVLKGLGPIGLELHPLQSKVMFQLQYRLLHHLLSLPSTLHQRVHVLY